MSFARTVISKRANFLPASPSAPTSSRAIFGVGPLGPYCGIIKSAEYADIGDKQPLTNDSVVDTVTYTGLGWQVTLECVFKVGTMSSTPRIGDRALVAAPQLPDSDAADSLNRHEIVIDEVTVQYEEERYRTIRIVGTHHYGFNGDDTSDTDPIALRLQWLGTGFGSPIAPARLGNTPSNWIGE